MSKSVNTDLYLVADRELSQGRPITDIVKAAAEGGVTLVQLREKGATTREYLEIATDVKQILKPYGIPLIINDRLDIALAVEADGVHLGQNDMPYEIARKIMGSEAIIGISVESVEDAREAEKYDADYLGLSPIFSTPTKTDVSHELGLEGIREIRKISKHNLVGIGRMNAETAGEAIKAGVDGIAVVSAICSAEDPKKAASDLRAIIDTAKKQMTEKK
jgi:thiamine-phosphate pyrophosphorylase